ncbi:TetR/AcrR family transcriptional regulator [Streptomyces solicathayae]|uniref:TetR/AcrR family transcriptional regulator n=1 Tax=Streptomyces solicathayae TaxID=3081768 RepID=A0ABZ0LNR9_9ACTN|nr:TetR/AcrR family transcriptional regulator [Streptomyces sp. HUAS YS2]WOX20488.1 TetR/AcrR family transcriptional regulator [Streptomyces sp. HUAS YS2]
MSDTEAGKGPGRTDAGARRRRRRDPEWTYAALLDALLGLISESGREPTRKAIAERAGVSERTVFVHFADREALYVAAARRQAERWRAHAEPVPTAWETARKAGALVAQRGRMYEVMTPIRRIGLGLEADSPGLRGVMAEGDAWFRADLAAVFAPELGRGPDAEEPGGLLDALEAASSWAAWDHLRSRRGLDEATARAAIERTLRALLEVVPHTS